MVQVANSATSKMKQRNYEHQALHTTQISFSPKPAFFHDAFFNETHWLSCWSSMLVDTMSADIRRTGTPTPQRSSATSVHRTLFHRYRRNTVNLFMLRGDYKQNVSAPHQQGHMCSHPVILYIKISRRCHLQQEKHPVTHRMQTSTLAHVFKVRVLQVRNVTVVNTGSRAISTSTEALGNTFQIHQVVWALCKLLLEERTFLGLWLQRTKRVIVTHLPSCSLMKARWHSMRGRGKGHDRQES